jgi:Zn ribbon nucleic-acid-binding protein
MRRYAASMRPRGNCPECQLRDVTHVVEQDNTASVRLCKQCAYAYDHPARVVELDKLDK